MSEPDFHKILLNAFFPDGIPPHQYGNLAVLMIDINELYDLHYQISRADKDNGGNIICRDGGARQEPPPVATKSPQNIPDVPPKPYISGTYPANFEDAPVQPITQKKKMGRPPRAPGSLGLKCPNCGSEDVLAGGFGPNKERRIKCKTCGSQPTVDISARPFFTDRIDERILALEFDDLSPEEISERLKSDGASIPASDITARLTELHTTIDGGLQC